MERIKSREFILQANQKLALSDDQFFNSYNPDAKDPAWKALIKTLIGWQKPDRTKQFMVQEAVIKGYINSVTVSETGAGAIQISVTHRDPESASDYANGLMELVRETIEDQDNTSKFSLVISSRNARQHLQDMEAAQGKLKEYTPE